MVPVVSVVSERVAVQPRAWTRRARVSAARQNRRHRPGPAGLFPCAIDTKTRGVDAAVRAGARSVQSENSSPTLAPRPARHRASSVPLVRSAAKPRKIFASVTAMRPSTGRGVGYPDGGPPPIGWPGCWCESSRTLPLPASRRVVELFAMAVGHGFAWPNRPSGSRSI